MIDPVVPATDHAWRWHRHPAFHDVKLSLGEKAADRLRNGMGSWPFVFIFIAAMLGWATLNTIYLQRVAHSRPFDPYPYILLNLLLSTIAGLQGAVLLIAAKRSDQIAAVLAQHDLETTIKISAKVDALASHLGCVVPADTLTVPQPEEHQ